MSRTLWQQFIGYDSCSGDRTFLLQCLSLFLQWYGLQCIAHINFTERRNVNLFCSKLLWKLLFKGFVLKEACLFILLVEKKWNGFLLWFSFYLQETQQDSFHQKYGCAAFRTACRGAKTSQWCWWNPGSCLLNTSYISLHWLLFWNSRSIVSCSLSI